MAEFPAMPVYTDAYIADTQHLTNEENGCYWKLLMFAWRSPNCALPDDDKRLATILGLTLKRWREKIRPVIAPFWDIQGGVWTQKKQRKVREKVEKNVQQKRDAYSQTERAKRLKNNGSGGSDDTPNGSSTEEPTKTKEEDSESYTTVRTKDSDSESHPNNCRSGDRPRASKTKFENWWSCWRIPGTKRGSKPKSMQAYAAIIRSGEKTHDELCQLVHRHMDFYEAEGRELSRMLHPLTWLNGKRWNDELVLDAPNGGNQHVQNRRESVFETAAKVLERKRRLEAAEGDHETVAEDQAHGGSGGAAGGDLFAVVDGSLELASPPDGGSVEPDRRQRGMVASVLDGGRRLAEPDKRHRLREPMVSHQSRKHSRLG